MKKIKIIIVENDEDEQFFMKEGFEESGDFTILAFAENGDQLLTILNDTKELPDLILSDLNMPGKNGYDILKEVNADARFSKIPVIITSTSSIKSVVDNCLKLGATRFVQKPETFVEYGSFAKKIVQLMEVVQEG
jgi:CheY-like chemotaxis protein